MTRPVLFAAATLLPVALLLGAAIGGGWLVVFACLYLTVFAAGMDELVGFAAGEDDQGSEFPAAEKLSVTLAVAHYVLMILAVAAISGWTGLGLFERLGVFFSFGLFFGQVSNSNAHELIHRSKRSLFRLGKWVYISMLFGHHTSAHTRIHHTHVGTVNDPNTAQLGESFYEFFPRAWVGSFRAGLEIEREMAAMRGRPRWRNPYLSYVAGAVLCLVIAVLIGGVQGLVGYVLLSGYAQAQLLMSDYVQHYGLERRVGLDGRAEPVGDRHSWNAPHWFSNALMLNAPKHSDHHAHPSKPFHDLTTSLAAPTLPRSLPVMATLALFPTLWHRVMDRRARAWAADGAEAPAIAAE